MLELIFVVAGYSAISTTTFLLLSFYFSVWTRTKYAKALVETGMAFYTKNNGDSGHTEDLFDFHIRKK